MAWLVRWDRLQALKRAAMLLFGLPLSLVGPAVLATVFWFAAFMFGLVGFRETWTSFWWAAVIVVVPSVFIAEIRTRGDYLT